MKQLAKPKNFRELETRIASLPVIEEAVRRSLRSNCKRFCEIAGRPEDVMPCDVPYVRCSMAAATPAALGVSPGNWAKICSGVWRSLELGGFPVLRGTGIELTNELAAMLDGVPKHPHQTELTALLKFVLDKNLSPWSLHQRHMPEYREWLKGRYTRANWSRALKKSLARWKKCQATYPERWPQSPLEPEYEERDWALPWSAMPTLEAAVEEHLEVLRRPRKRRHAGFRKIMKESSIAARKGLLRRFASAIYLATSIVPETLEDLTNPERVEVGVDYIMDKRGIETSGDVYQMLRHVNAIARHHLKRSEKDLDELKEIRKSVAPPKGPADKNRKLIEQFRNAELREKFVEEPGRVLNKLKRSKSLNRAELAEGTMAFLAALLTKVPMRISEAMSLRFGDSIHDHGTGRHRQVVIDIPADLVKNDVPRNAKLGPKLVALLDIYKEFILKNTANPGNPYLFPSSGTLPRSADHMSQQLAAWTTRHVVRMTAHQFRHVVGYIFLLDNPGCYDTVRRFLGHRSVTTTMEYYAFVLDDDANESLDRTIDKLSGR